MTHAPKGQFIRSIPFDHEARQAFGRHLHAAMCARSMTSKQLALVAGVADPTIKTLAAGNKNNTVDKLSMYVIVGIADGLGIPAEEVISWTGKGTIVAKRHIDEARPKAQERSARYRAQAEAEMRKEAEALNPKLAASLSAPSPFVEAVKPAPDVSLASVMVKLRKLTVDDLILIDELISELAQ